MKYSRKYALFITLLFALFLSAFFVANAVSPDREFSPLENRTLAQAPQLTLSGVRSGRFMEDFESYITDQFSLRDRWIALKAATEKAMGKLENNGVYLCDKDTLIPRFGPFSSDKDQKRINNNFGYVDTLSALTEAPVYFSLIPGKVSVWGDRLPAGAPNDDETAYIARGGGSKARWIDTSSAPNAHREEYIYYRTDHHWTTLGAYYGYEAIVKAMGLTPKPLADLTPQVVSEEFYGTTFSSSGVRWVKPDAITLYVPQEAAEVVNYYDANPTEGKLYNMEQLSEKDKYAMFLGGNKPLTVLKSKAAPEGAPKLLLVRDSYSDSLAPFLCYNFSEVHLVDPRYYKVSPAQYVKDNGIDDVLVLYSVDNFLSDANLFVLAMPAK